MSRGSVSDRVAQFNRKHHKQVWIKEAWGPPSDVFADVTPNDSVLYRYLMVVEFSLEMRSGPERYSTAEADRDIDLSPIPYMPKGRFRNVYLVGTVVSRLKSREVLSHDHSSSGSWWTGAPVRQQLLLVAPLGSSC